MKKIGELSRITGCSVQAIRHYEKKQLITAFDRSEGNFRLYDETAIDRLLFIKQCRNLSLSLSEIRQLLTLQCSADTQCDGVNQLIDAHIRQVEARVQELTGLNDKLKALRANCENLQKIDQCGILRSLSAKQQESNKEQDYKDRVSLSSD